MDGALVVISQPLMGACPQGRLLALISLGFSICDMGITLEPISNAHGRVKSVNNFFIKHLAEIVFSLLILLSPVTSLSPNLLIGTKEM